MAISFNGQGVQSYPAKENSNSSKFCERGESCIVGTIATVALLIFASVVTGVTLITLGALTGNPSLMDAGLTLVALPILIVAGAFGYRVTVY